jgi:hypothetical protein|tara:strand:- start:772 stop:921 length:150 start_codon:yes stop_codon:yes gene_type:complete
MEIKLNQEQINKITQILNEFPIKELAKVQAISTILQESNNNKNESNKKN